MVEGYIYVLFNPSLREGHFKIGKTTRTPKQRASELSVPTGVPTPYEVIYQEKVLDCDLAESLVHGALRSKRVSSNREFFQVELKDAIVAIQSAADQVGRSNTDSSAENISDLNPSSHPMQSTSERPETEFNIESPAKTPKAARDESEKQRQLLRFWTAFLEATGKSDPTLLALRPPAYYFCVTEKVMSSVYYCFTLNTASVRCELFIATTDATFNMSVYDRLIANKVEIEREFGSGLDWRSGKTCGVKHEIAKGDYRKPEDWEKMFANAAEAHQRLVAAVRRYL